MKLALAISGGLAAAMLLCVVGIATVRDSGRRQQRTVLYNQWGTKDHNEHWGGVGSENYHTAKWDNTGSNADYHPRPPTRQRDSSSGDADAMEPAWWRNGPGANSEYTGKGTSGELYNPPDQKVFKPFFMRSPTQDLFDVDGPSPRDPHPASWAASGRGTASWMLAKGGALLASKQGPHPRPQAHLGAAVKQQQLRAAAAPPRGRVYDADGPSPRDLPARAWAAGGKGTTEWMLTHEGPLLASQQGPIKHPAAARAPAVVAGKRGQGGGKRGGQALAGLAPAHDADGPSPRDLPMAAWAKGGEGSAGWLLTHGGPLLAAQQGPPKKAGQQAIPRKAAAGGGAAKAPEGHGAAGKAPAGRGGGAVKH